MGNGLCRSARAEPLATTGDDGAKLSAAETARVLDAWLLIQLPAENVMARSLAKAMARSAVLRSTVVGGSQPSQADLNDLLLQLGNKFRDFLSLCIDFIEAHDWTGAQQAATLLGARHVYYGGDNRFQPIFWDIFVLSMVEVLEELSAEEASAISLKHDDIYLWQRFFSVIVEWMRQGYQEQDKEAKETTVE